MFPKIIENIGLKILALEPFSLDQFQKHPVIKIYQ
jgi:hypothetical protein